MFRVCACMRFTGSIFKPYDVILGSLAAALVVIYVQAAGGGFPLDDSWIHQVYGRNLAQTGQWAFITGQPSAASTSPLYTVLLAAGYRLNISYVVWTHLLGAVSLFLTGALGARLAEAHLPGQRFGGLLTGAALVLAWHLVWAAASGMETMLFGMFTLVLIALAWRELGNIPADSPHIVIRGAMWRRVGALTT